MEWGLDWGMEFSVIGVEKDMSGTRITRDGADASSGRVRVTTELSARAPYDVAGMLGYLAAHAVPGRDRLGVDGVSLPGPDGETGPRGATGSTGALATEHALDVPGGTAVARIDWAAVPDPPDGGIAIPVRLDLPSVMDTRAAISALRHLFDLDTDAREIRAAFAADPRLGPLVAVRPGLRVGGARSAAEFALGVVLGQQVSLAAARTLQGRLAARFPSVPPGPPAPDGFLPAPDPAAVAALPEDEIRAALGITGARAATLRALAGALADGLDLGPDGDPEVARRALAEIRGIGPWTIELIALRSLRDPDGFPSGDLILRRALGDPTPRAAERLAEPWRPFRGYATQHLWTATLAARAAPDPAAP